MLRLMKPVIISRNRDTQRNKQVTNYTGYFIEYTELCSVTLCEYVPV
jgi:hypothetical protein